MAGQAPHIVLVVKMILNGYDEVRSGSFISCDTVFIRVNTKYRNYQRE